MLGPQPFKAKGGEKWLGTSTQMWGGSGPSGATGIIYADRMDSFGWARHYLSISVAYSMYNVPSAISN